MEEVREKTEAEQPPKIGLLPNKPSCSSEGCSADSVVKDDELNRWICKGCGASWTYKLVLVLIGT